MSIRGEVPLTVCGKAVSIAPTYRAIEAIEQRLGTKFPRLLEEALSVGLGIRDMAVIVHEGLRAAGHTGLNGAGEAFALEQIGEDVLQNLSSYSIAVGTFVGNALGGPPKKEQRPDGRVAKRSRGVTTSTPPPAD